MRDRRDPEEIRQELNATAAGGQSVGRSPAEVNSARRHGGNRIAPETGSNFDSAGNRPVTGDSIERMQAAQAGLDSRAAKFFSWLGNHFLAVTLVITGVFLFWALR
ncbi:MAG: hypothetical protein VW985_13830 [Gammaproteobacteria bacterium]